MTILIVLIGRPVFGFSAGGNMPFCRVSFYPDFMVVGFIGPTLIPYSEIESAEYRRRFLSKGVELRLHGSKPGAPIILFPNHPDKVMQILATKIKKPA